MTFPTLESLRHLGLEVDGIQSELLKVNASGSAVYRLRRRSEAGSPNLLPLVLKHIPGCARELPREVRFYREILPVLEAPHPQIYFTGQADSGGWLILIEDLGTTHYFPEPQYIWSVEELQAVLGLYARLHHAGEQILPPADQRGWLHSYTLDRSRLSSLPDIAAEFARRKIWPAPLPVERLVAELDALSETLRATPNTLLHSDLYPPNVALPKDKDGAAMLIDWDLAGCGAGELDLAYLYLQPFRSGSALTPADCLAIYWEARRRLGDEPPTEELLQARQHAASLQLSLWFLSVQAQVIEHPYPPGSPPAAYWEAMRGVLYLALARLSKGGCGA